VLFPQASIKPINTSLPSFREIELGNLIGILYNCIISIDFMDKNDASFYKNNVPKMLATREIPTQDESPILAGELSALRLLDNRLLVLPETPLEFVLFALVLLSGILTTKRRYLPSPELFPLFPFDLSSSKM
jgi:hypothetical protein